MDIFSIHLEGITLLVVLIGLVLVSLGLFVFGVYSGCRLSEVISEYNDDDWSQHVHKDWNPYEVLGVNKNPCAETSLMEAKSFPMGHPFGPLQRYDDDGIHGIGFDPEGEFVRFEEHDQIVRKQSLTIEQLRKEIASCQT